MANNDEVSRLTSALGALFSDLTDAVVRDKPRDLIDYVANHFTRMRDERRTKSVPLYVVVDDDELAVEPDRETFLPTAVRCLKEGWRDSVASESYDPEADTLDDDDDDDAENTASSKSDEQRQRLADALQNIFLFRSLDDELMSRVIDAMFERKVAPGDYVIRQGDPGDNFYVIENGIFDVIKKERADSDCGQRVLRLDGHGSFGELALMYNQPRAANVVAVTSGTLWAMDRPSFRRIVLQSAFRKRQMYEEFLKAVPMLNALCDYERATLADALRSQTYPDGACIIREGDLPADGMYFIEKGSARLTVRSDDGQTEVTIGCLEAGDYFGEVELLEGGPRPATVYAKVSNQKDDLLTGRRGSTGAARSAAGVTVAFLERESFERLLGPCVDVMRRKSSAFSRTLSSHLLSASASVSSHQLCGP